MLSSTLRHIGSLGLIAGPMLASACTTGAPQEGQAPNLAAATAPEAGVAGMTPIELSDPSAYFGGDGAFSPDGRWLAMTRLERTNNWSLWTLSAEGGDPQRLTDAGYLDDYPVWAPSGDRIFFRSTRPARDGSGFFIMSLDVDPASGLARGTPRQVTVEPVSSHPSPSPDGQSLAYRSNGTEIRVVPTTGGASRLITTTGAGNRSLAWEPDGSAIYFVQRGGVHRVPVAGGEPALVVGQVGGPIAAFHAGARVMAITRDRTPRGQTLEIFDFSGALVRSVRVSSLWQAVAFTPDGEALVGVTQDVPALIRVRPVQGGEPRDLLGAGTYDWPMSWTEDSRGVITQSNEGDRNVVRILYLDGTPARIIPMPEEVVADNWGPQSWATPTHASYTVPSATGGGARLMALDLSSGRRSVLREELGREAFGPGTRWGPGGLYRDLDGFFYSEVADGQAEVMTLRPGEPPRLISRVPGDGSVRAYAFQEDREAYMRVAGDSVAVMIAEPRGTTPRVLFMGGRTAVRTPYENQDRLGVLTFSYDGSLLALNFDEEGSRETALILRVPESGRATDVRRVNVEAEYWFEPKWLPDNSGFTVIAGSGETAWVAFVPAGGGSVRHISRDDDMPTWGHEVSPDGRWVVYPAEDYRGSALWRLEVSEAAVDVSP